MRYRRTPGLLWRSTPGYLVVSTVDGQVAEAAGPAPEIWCRLADWTDEPALVEALVRQFAAEEGSIAADVHAFLQQLRAAGYVDATE